MEDPHIVADLRSLNSTTERVKFDRFWDECQAVLNEEVGIAVDDRRHTEITHLATAISIRDCFESVCKRLPEDTPVPSQEWLRLQFWPKTAHSKKKLHYTGRLKVRFMIQQRQFQKQHPDQHYAAAVFRYQREYACKLRDCSAFVCLDDKHCIKVGEPGYPVAAAERGRRVMVSMTKSFQVGDHDFTKFSLIPSVALLVNIPEQVVNIPEQVSNSWYTGKVYVGVKDAVFEPSSPLCHTKELSNVLTSNYTEVPPALFLYTDGGPDHRLTYVSVQISLIALFLQHDLDFLCAARTAPQHSWRNPVERVMSLLNLGLQCVGLMRAEMPDEYESAVRSCGNLGELRKARSSPDYEAALSDSLAPCKALLCNLFSRLQLKGEPVRSFFSASAKDIEEFWNALLRIDQTLDSHVSYTKCKVKDKEQLLKFMRHCCQERHYSFCIKKCGE